MIAPVLARPPPPPPPAFGEFSDEEEPVAKRPPAKRPQPTPHTSSISNRHQDTSCPSSSSPNKSRPSSSSSSSPPPTCSLPPLAHRLRCCPPPLPLPPAEFGARSPPSPPPIWLENFGSDANHVHGLPARAGHPRGGGRLVGRPEHLWLPHHDEPRRDRRPRSQGMHTPRSEVSYHVSNSSDPANMHANMGEGVEYHTLYGGRPYPNHYTNPYP